MLDLVDKYDYCQISNISRALDGNNFFDNSDVVGAAPTTSSFSINGSCNENCETRWESFKFGDLVRLILDILRYVYLVQIYGQQTP